MTNATRQTLETVVRALASAGIVRTRDIADAASLVAGLNPESVKVWAREYGYDAQTAERVRRACATGHDARIPAEGMSRAYIAAVVVVLAVYGKQYNRGQLAELAVAILLGLFPNQGKANGRPAATDVPDIVFGEWGLSCKNVAERCTFVDGDKADRLLAMLGNVDVLYILTRPTWAELEDRYAEVETSRGTKRSPRSKKSIAKMVEWLEGLTA